MCVQKSYKAYIRGDYFIIIILWIWLRICEFEHMCIVVYIEYIMLIEFACLNVKFFQLYDIKDYFMSGYIY